MRILPNLQLWCSWDKDELNRFWGQRSKVTEKCQISTLGGIFSPVSITYGHTLMQLVTIIHYQVCITLMTFSRSWVQRSRSRTKFSENALLWWRHTNWQLAVKDVWFSVTTVRLTSLFVVGWLTDNTDTYNVSFVASGIVICCSGLLLLAAPALRRCDHIAVIADNKSEESDDQEASTAKAAAAEPPPSTSWNSN